MPFNAYWNSKRYRKKRPNLFGSTKQAYGDNIYFRDSDGQWRQENSHHSYADGTPNADNIAPDTRVDRVLLSENFAYWGGFGPVMPREFRNTNGVDICARRGHKSRFSRQLVANFIAWFVALDEHGYRSSPLEWSRTQPRVETYNEPA